jgi:outer membrane protein OmpA-like peptidoglycan-associated protein
MVRETRVKNIRPGIDAIDAMILGFFAFDEAEFSSMDMSVVDKARNHQAAGGRVRIIAMTDALGDAGENARLAKQRAQEAVKVLGLPDVTVQLRAGGLQDNGTPEGRSRNRSVLVICE